MTTNSSRPAADPVGGTACKAAVLGFPIEHSRSPDLHRAAYRALGLDGWTYERIECPAGELATIVDNLDEAYLGLSVTMPGKGEALAYAATVTERAALVGSANTLVRRADGWFADCTDIDGVTGALGAVGADFTGGGSAVKSLKRISVNSPLSITTRPLKRCVAPNVVQRTFHVSPSRQTK